MQADTEVEALQNTANSAGNNDDSDDEPHQSEVDIEEPEVAGEEYVEPPLYGEKMEQSEARGLTHWMLYAEGAAVYAYDIVTGDKVAAEVLTLDTPVSNLAVDANKGYLFVGSATSDESKAKIDRYNFTVDDKDRTNPSLAVNATSVLNVFEGDSVGSLAIDDD